MKLVLNIFFAACALAFGIFSLTNYLQFQKIEEAYKELDQRIDTLAFENRQVQKAYVSPPAKFDFISIDTFKSLNLRKSSPPDSEFTPAIVNRDFNDISLRYFLESTDSKFNGQAEIGFATTMDLSKDFYYAQGFISKFNSKEEFNNITGPPIKIVNYSVGPKRIKSFGFYFQFGLQDFQGNFTIRIIGNKVFATKNAFKNGKIKYSFVLGRDKLTIIDEYGVIAFELKQYIDNIFSCTGYTSDGKSIYLINEATIIRLPMTATPDQIRQIANDNKKYRGPWPPNALTAPGA